MRQKALIDLLSVSDADCKNRLKHVQCGDAFGANVSYTKSDRNNHPQLCVELGGGGDLVNSNKMQLCALNIYIYQVNSSV